MRDSLQDVATAGQPELQRQEQEVADTRLSAREAKETRCEGLHQVGVNQLYQREPLRQPAHLAEDRRARRGADRQGELCTDHQSAEEIAARQVGRRPIEQCTDDAAIWQQQ